MKEVKTRVPPAQEAVRRIIESGDSKEMVVKQAGAIALVKNRNGWSALHELVKKHGEFALEIAKAAPSVLVVTRANDGESAMEAALVHKEVRDYMIKSQLLRLVAAKDKRGVPLLESVIALHADAAKLLLDLDREGNADVVRVLGMQADLKTYRKLAEEKAGLRGEQRK